MDAERRRLVRQMCDGETSAERWAAIDRLGHSWLSVEALRDTCDLLRDLLNDLELAEADAKNLREQIDPEQRMRLERAAESAGELAQESAVGIREDALQEAVDVCFAGPAAAPLCAAPIHCGCRQKVGEAILALKTRW